MKRMVKTLKGEEILFVICDTSDTSENKVTSYNEFLM